DRRWREYLDARGQGGNDTLRSTAVLWDGEVCMANLSIIGSHSVNGVAALHTQILKDDVFKDFFTIMPGNFCNKTNGVSHRRFLMEANPGLTELISSAIGDGWIRDPEKLQDLMPFRDDAAFLEKLAQIKREGKVRLSNYIKEKNEIATDPDGIFDVHVKRIHAYKHQLLGAFKVLDLYNSLKADPGRDMEPVTFIFAGKAAQGYAFAREVIKFINSIADVVNSDPEVRRKIKVVFPENFCVSLGQIIYPAADISEQISTAGKEASGTGNMKFMMNGAITLGTMDGANVEIHQALGGEDISIFGLSAEETAVFYRYGGYSAQQTASEDGRLSRMTQQLVDGFFKRSGTDFWGIYDALLRHNDEYFVLKDFASYIDAWNGLTALHRDSRAWNRASLHNIAASGSFSSDRTIREYAEEIWNIKI
ncbi:MAG: glycogen/starch/alpha-glucan phosphorylase, partial [Firmicutes bacterium]|nr:glycogen/starch/alpha-glucan phosphorylase [Bacillota bacterium]